jgi:hypothetical protein
MTEQIQPSALTESLSALMDNQASELELESCRNRSGKRRHSINNSFLHRGTSENDRANPTISAYRIPVSADG